MVVSLTVISGPAEYQAGRALESADATNDVIYVKSVTESNAVGPIVRTNERSFVVSAKRTADCGGADRAAGK